MQHPEETSNLVVKIRVMGHKGAGKSTLIKRYAGNSLIFSSSSTHARVQRKGVTLDIQEKTTHQSSNLSPILVTVDLTDLDSFQQAEQWLNGLTGQKKPPIVLVGTNFDKPLQRVVAREQLTRLKETHPEIVGCIEVNSTTGENVSEAFEMATTTFLQQSDPKRAQ